MRVYGLGFLGFRVMVMNHVRDNGGDDDSHVVGAMYCLQ